MAMSIITKARARAGAENSADNTEAGQAAQRASRIVIRSMSEQRPALFPPPGSPVASPRKATAPGSPRNRLAEQAGEALPSQPRAGSPLPTRLVRRINRLAGDDNDKSSRALLRLHGDDAMRGDDPLAPLNIQWLISTDEEMAPGAPGRATPSLAGTEVVAGASPFLPASAMAGRRKKTPSADAEAVFDYPGPDNDRLQFAQWIEAHPLCRMFRQVYPRNDAVSLLMEDVRTPVHAVLEGGISDPARFHRSLLQICDQADSRFTRLETLFRDAVAVSRQGAGPLQGKADFFSRFFSALIALGSEPDPHQKARISETLRQEWLETDFGMLLDLPEARHLKAHWQAAEPARTQVSGRRSFADAMGRDAMSPRKKQKTVHHHEASTPSAGEHQSPARQAPDSPWHASPQSEDAHGNSAQSDDAHSDDAHSDDAHGAADLSPPSCRDHSPLRSRSLSWKSSALKRAPKLTGREFTTWLANMPATGGSPSSPRRPQRAGSQPGSDANARPLQRHEERLPGDGLRQADAMPRETGDGSI